VYAQEAAKQRKLIYQLEKERERLGSDAAEVRIMFSFFFFFSKVAGEKKEIKRKNCDSHLSVSSLLFSFFSFFSLSLIRTTQVEVRYQKVCEEVKLKEMQITDMGKKVTESEQKLKQQQQLYEAVRSDRNLYSKNLIESQDEIAEMKRKFKIMSHQIEQLKGTGAAWSCCWSVSLLFTILDRYLWIGVVDRYLWIGGSLLFY